MSAWEMLTYSGRPWAPLIALGIVAVGFVVVIGGWLLLQGVLIDLKVASRRRAAMRVTPRRLAPAVPELESAPLVINHAALTRGQ